VEVEELARTGKEKTSSFLDEERWKWRWRWRTSRDSGLFNWIGREMSDLRIEILGIFYTRGIEWERD
jgi:hypothetical protein